MKRVMGLTIVLGTLSVGMGLPARGQLAITEVMSGSSHPATDVLTGLGGLANGDWWELTNTTSSPIDLTGYLWDDNGRLTNPNGFTQFPNNFILQPFEAVLIVEESQANVDAMGGWREAWMLPPSVRILARDAMLGPDTFSGLSGTNGDEVNVYDPNRNLVVGVAFPPVGTLGFSFEWEPNGTSLGFSVLGENDAYRAFLDGSQLPPPYPSLDVASPGIYVGQPGIDGDFDNDGVYGCLDVDALVGVIAAGSNVAAYDLNQDSFVNRLDLDLWLVEAGGVNFGIPYKYGDANLDSTVGTADFAIWNSAKFTATARWCAGDFNADGFVDGSDHSLWNANKAPASEAAGVVPEPHAVGLTLCLLMIACPRRRP